MAITEKPQVSEYYGVYIDLVYFMKDMKIIPLLMALRLEREVWIQSLRKLDGT